MEPEDTKMPQTQTSAANGTDTFVQSIAIGPQATRASILFCDICGFTRFAQAVSNQSLLTLLEGYSEAVSRMVRGCGGELDKIMGDGAMAVFRQRPDAPASALRAVQAALALQRAFQDLLAAEAGREPELVACLGLRVGIATGPTVEARLGPQLTQIGSTVNLASRLERLAPVGCVAVDRTTVVDCGSRVSFRQLNVTARDFETEPVYVLA
jgi:class 3 adenylate cyclase